MFSISPAPAGGSEVFLVREDNRASVVAVRLGRAVEDHWLILEGVKPGDRVIVDGFQKFVAGDVVSPKILAALGSANPERDRTQMTVHRYTKGSD
jgi:membrane fusion protein (multidrug efflux system)